MTDTNTQIVICSDNIGGGSSDSKMKQTVANALQGAGYKVTIGTTHSNAHNTELQRRRNVYIVYIVGGICAGTYYGFGQKWSQNLFKNNNNKMGIAYYWGLNKKYRCSIADIKFLERAHDDNFSPRSFKGLDNPAEYLNKAGIDIADGGTFDQLATNIVEMVKNGGTIKGGTSTGGSTGEGVQSALKSQKGFTNSGRGSTPQFWSRENFEEYQEINFKKAHLNETDPGNVTATFETKEDLPMLTGRTAVLINGDCNPFGGIVIEKTYHRSEGVWKYLAHGFLDRVMANEITYIGDGTEKVYDVIKQVLEDMAIPTTGLLPIDDYDKAISEELAKAMKADAKLTETSEMFKNQQQNQNSGGGSSSSSSSSGGTSSSSGGSSEEKKVLTKTVATTKDGRGINPMKKTVLGKYSAKSVGEFIRALIYDYGVNIRFWGDVNGIPHFDILDLERWKTTGIALDANMGFGQDYDKEIKITNVVTQVGVENISAINGAGEIYTAKELLGIDFEGAVGRMGVVVENPSANGETGDNSGSGGTEIKEKYQDKTGKQYEATKVLTTNGKPSCSNCEKVNGGILPTMQKYTKYWVNQCPGCKKEGTLKSNDEGDGVTTCSGCNKTYCQYCGMSTNGGNYQLLEVFPTNPTSTTDATKKSNAGTTTTTTQTTTTNTDGTKTTTTTKSTTNANATTTSTTKTTNTATNTSTKTT